MHISREYINIHCNLIILAFLAIGGAAFEALVRKIPVVSQAPMPGAATREHNVAIKQYVINFIEQYKYTTSCTYKNKNMNYSEL